MESNTKEQKVSVVVNIPWRIMWIAGFLFTLGIVAASGEFDFIKEYGTARQIFSLVFLYMLWPLFLGVHFAG
jgi:hypothetical protein